MDSYQFLTILYETGPISAWKGFDRTNNRLVTICKILATDTGSLAGKFLCTLNHQYLFKYYEIIEDIQPPAQNDENAVFLIKSYFEQESLEEYIQREFIDNDLMMDYLIQIAQGISHIHSLKLVHGDIQPRRIYLAVENNQTVCKIGDFNFFGAIQNVLPENSAWDRSIILPQKSHIRHYMLTSLIGSHLQP
jgi:serine/threonine protein kinase